ncbi:MAG: hypothetical protein CME06_05520, partial [Gemmatimonadetes bacterium]|nr:hypothetical protein [Gemmatimonadota bacterium]
MSVVSNGDFDRGHFFRIGVAGRRDGCDCDFVRSRSSVALWPPWDSALRSPGFGMSSIESRLRARLITTWRKSLLPPTKSSQTFHPTCMNCWPSRAP